MRSLRLLVLALLAFVAPLATAFAQSTANRVLPGVLTTVGCPSANLTPCWAPYSSTNPLPITGAGGTSILGKVQIDQTTPGTTNGVVVNAGTANIGGVAVTPTATNPTASITLPSTTTAYTAGQLICTSATVATCNAAIAANPLSISTAAGAAIIPRLRLQTTDTTSTAWGGQTITVDLWSAAPTFQTTGDRGAFVTDLLTGTAGHLAAFTCTMAANAANSDGTYGECVPAYGNFALVKLASGTSIYWTATATTGSGVTGASKVLTVTAELLN